MRYDKKDRAKIVVLAVVLVGLWGFIGVRFALLSRQRKAELRAQQQAQASAQPQPTPDAGAPGSQTRSPALRLAALVAPVPPPTSDPFHPIIPPRTSEGSSAQPAAATRRPPEREQAPPVLPPLPGSESSYRGGKDRLTLTGIIVGNPSTAVLRMGDDHYVVREGDILDTTLRVQKITRTAVTLREGRTAYTLRIGG
jgi:hypothetical protein